MEQRCLSIGWQGTESKRGKIEKIEVRIECPCCREPVIIALCVSTREWAPDVCDCGAIVGLSPTTLLAALKTAERENVRLAALAVATA